MVELVAVQLPGREGRIKEAPLNRLPDIVAGAVRAIRPHVNRPYALFGHSMGALIAFEVARQLRNEGAQAPAHFFVSARRAPHCPDPLPKLHQLPDGELLDELCLRWGGIPAAVLREPELLELLLPTLRADLAVIESYVHVGGAPLDCPISVFGGEHDKTVNRGELLAWQKQSSGRFRFSMLPGSHFFIRTHHEEVVRAVVEDLLPILAAADPNKLRSL